MPFFFIKTVYNVNKRIKGKMMRITSVEATAPNGKKYEMTRMGRIIGTGGFAAYGAYQANKLLHDDRFIKQLAEDARKAGENNLHTFTKTRKTVYGIAAAAIMALCGFVVGGVADFLINRSARNRAMKPEEQVQKTEQKS